jgi:glutamine phosphoribosylpyrophosphate amidotransferase
MLAGFGIIAFRDPNGVRPVGMAVRKSGTGTDHIIASESVVADAGGFTDWQDVKPGQSRLFTSNFVVIMLRRTLFTQSQAKRSSSQGTVSRGVRS